VADDLTPGPFPVPVTVAMRVRIVTDASGRSSFADDDVVAGDIEITSSIWQQAGIAVVAESIEQWSADEYAELVGIENDQLKEEDWDPGQMHIDVYYVEATDSGAGWGTPPWRVGGHAITLEDQEEEMGAAGSAAWRGIALAHELGHYLGLNHTHSGDPATDAGYDDGCPDTDIADPRNVMTQGSRGRITVASEIHLTADQIERARGYLFSHRANLVADVVAAVSADRHGRCDLELAFAVARAALWLPASSDATGTDRRGVRSAVVRRRRRRRASRSCPGLPPRCEFSARGTT
jgi:hypothetical protein